MKIGSFKILTFIIATVICGIFTFITLVAAGATDEGTGGLEIITVVLAKLFYIFRFPTHTLFWSTITRNSGETFFIGGLVLNCFFYGLITERIISFVKSEQTTGK